MEKGYELKEDVIVINRDLTELDLFVKDFLDVLKKHSEYLIVSGFVSISTGRTRGTEDVDLLVPVLNEIKFNEIFQDLQKNNFWCYQGDSSKEIYLYVKKKNVFYQYVCLQPSLIYLRHHFSHYLYSQ